MNEDKKDFLDMDTTCGVRKLKTEYSIFVMNDCPTYHKICDTSCVCYCGYDSETKSVLCSFGMEPEKGERK